MRHASRPRSKPASGSAPATPANADPEKTSRHRGEPSDALPGWVFVLLLAAAGIGTGLVLVLIAHLVHATHLQTGISGPAAARGKES